MAQKSQPLWLQFVYRVERAIGTPLESALRSDAYFDLVTQANRAGARATHTFEELQRRWLQLFNLPAGSDLRAVREQLARVERRLSQLAKELEDGGPPPTE
jgi:hypothetical protein